MTIVYFVPLIILAIFFIILIAGLYNSIVVAKNSVKESFSSIDVHLKLRFDLIPNLVTVVKGYAKHEKEVFDSVTKLRAQIQTEENNEKKLLIANQAASLIEKIFAISENYPRLKSSEVFLKLSNEIVEVEDKIAAARRFYNSAVKHYNNVVQKFPSNLIAKMFRFKKIKSIKILSIEKSAPMVEAEVFGKPSIGKRNNKKEKKV